MFKVAMVANAPVSVGHMIEILAGFPGTLKKGSLCCIVEGTTQSAEGNCPDGVISDIVKVGDDEYHTVMLLTPDVILAAPVSNYSDGKPTGSYVGYSNTGVDMSGQSSWCQVVDLLSAEKNGDTILVRFVKKDGGK